MGVHDNQIQMSPTPQPELTDATTTAMMYEDDEQEDVKRVVAQILIDRNH